MAAKKLITSGRPIKWLPFGAKVAKRMLDSCDHLYGSQLDTRAFDKLTVAGATRQDPHFRCNILSAIVFISLNVCCKQLLWRNLKIN